MGRYEKRVVTNCRYLSGSPADADDLAQEVMIKVFYGLAGFEGRSAFKTWLMRVKSNHCINFVNKRRLETVGLDEGLIGGRAGAVEPDAWRDLERQEAARRVGEILLRMPDTLRIPLVLRDMDGLEYQEIAEELGIGLSALKMRIMRGRSEFRRLAKETASMTSPLESA